MTSSAPSSGGIIPPTAPATAPPAMMMSTANAGGGGGGGGGGGAQRRSSSGGATAAAASASAAAASASSTGVGIEPNKDNNPLMAECLLEFLLGEVLRWVEEECDPDKQQQQQQDGKRGSSNKAAGSSNDEEKKDTDQDNTTDGGGGASISSTPMDKEERAILAAEMAAAKIERLGFSVGYRLCERLAQTRPLASTPPAGTGTAGGATAPTPPVPSIPGTTDPTSTTTTTTTTTPPPAINPANVHLEAVKFLCKEFWTEIFRKQIDKLQTNHRGVFVLKDHELRWLRRLPSDDERSRVAAIKLLAFPCGLIRGALSNLGIGAVVSCDFLADGKNMAACSFNIKIKN